MAVPTNHYKLGLFIIIGFAAAILVAVVLGGAGLHHDTIRYHSYFNESVQGLDLGSQTWQPGRRLPMGLSKLDSVACRRDPIFGSASRILNVPKPMSGVNSAVRFSSRKACDVC